MMHHAMPASRYVFATVGTASTVCVTVLRVWPRRILKLIVVSAPVSRLLEMFSRWPRYLYQGPAGEMWSVVHLPLSRNQYTSVTEDVNG